MNTQRLTMITVGIIVLAIIAVIVVSRLTSTSSVADLDLTGQPVYGDPGASIQVVLFEDFLCPHCATFTENILPQLKREFGDTGQASFHYVDFLVMAGSEVPAVAAECVYRQDNDAFWDVNPVMMRSQAITRDPARSFEIARDYAPGIDEAALQECIADPQVVADVRAEREMATSAGATGTPAVFVNGRSVSPSYAQIANAINAELD